MRRFFHPVQEYIELHIANPELTEFIQPLSKAFIRLQQATGQVAVTGMSNPEEAAGVASEYLKLFGLVALAFMWCRMAEVALQKTAADNSGFYDAQA